MASPEEPRRTIHFVGVPISDFVNLQVYFDDMVREMQLIAVGVDDGNAAGRLADLAVYVQHDIAGNRNTLHAQALAAEATGATHVDLTLDLLPVSVTDARRLIGVVTALDAQSRSGQMLTAPASPLVLNVLEWLVEEVERQLGAGLPPRPYASPPDATLSA